MTEALKGINKGVLEKGSLPFKCKIMDSGEGFVQTSCIEIWSQLRGL